MASRTTIAAVLATIIVTSIAWLPATADDKSFEEPATAADASAAKDTSDWHKDPDCRMTFFAVLEGLYEDGVSNETVDLIIGKAKGKDRDVKHSFVFRCKLCHATYEAFVQYRQRTAFTDGKGVDTFGKGVDAKTIQSLKSKDVYTRISAMGGMVNGWLNKYIERKRLTTTEKVALLNRLLKHAGDGNNRFKKYRRDGKAAYIDWQFYDGCQACKAAENIANDFRKSNPEAADSVIRP